METKTTIGRDLINLNYQDDPVKQVDDLFFQLYCMHISERDDDDEDWEKLWLHNHGLD